MTCSYSPGIYLDFFSVAFLLSGVLHVTRWELGDGKDVESRRSVVKFLLDGDGSCLAPSISPNVLGLLACRHFCFNY